MVKGQIAFQRFHYILADIVNPVADCLMSQLETILLIMMLEDACPATHSQPSIAAPEETGGSAVQTRQRRGTPMVIRKLLLYQTLNLFRVHRSIGGIIDIKGGAKPMKQIDLVSITYLLKIL